jgi:hypothetical protein
MKHWQEDGGRKVERRPGINAFLPSLLDLQSASFCVFLPRPYLLLVLLVTS